jgi:hypothetical protein
MTGAQTASTKLPQVGIASVWFEGNPCNMHPTPLFARGVSGPYACFSMRQHFSKRRV